MYVCKSMYVCMYVRTYVKLCIYVCLYTRAQRETMIQHIGTWPTGKQNLINKHQKIFSWFVESIDFDDMQQSD
jgi:hypothetical protein